MRCIQQARRNTSVRFQLIIVETETNYLEDYADYYIHFPKKTISTLDINEGFRACNTEWCGLLTNDVYVEDGWLEALLNTFKVKDCGLATLGSTQFNDHKRDEIKFGVWCSVFLTKHEYLRKHGFFDAEKFPCVWDDSDFLMKLALDGLLPYKNYSSIAHHKIGLTEYSNQKHEELYIKNGLRFNEKYANCGHWLYDYLKLKV